MTGSLNELRRLAVSHAGPLVPDSQLLRRFTDERDQIAFAELVRRYGSLVFGVCRRILKDTHHAEDAFQAVFLVLSRRAESLRDPERLAPWLYGVACRIALKARQTQERRPMQFAAEVECADSRSQSAEISLPVLDEAIHALPAKYREPIVLCYFEGLTNAQAADRIGCPLGTVATRLARARDLLRTRLARRGFVVPAAMLLAMLERAGASPSESLLIATVANVRGPVDVGIISLMEGASFVMKIKITHVALGALLLVGLGGFGWKSFQAGAGEPRPPVTDRPIPPPTASNDAQIVTPNFIVDGVPARTARLIAGAAEQHRKQLALAWIGRELPNWPTPCPIKVRIDQSGKASNSATVFTFNDGKVEQSMTLEGSLEHILSDSLPHEVTHTVLASHFRKPMPRWADEGIAILSESPEEQQRYERRLVEAIANAKMIKLSKLFSMNEYPKDVLVFHAQSASIVRYLVQKKDRPTVLAFIKDGIEKDWNRAVRAHYGFAGVDALEEEWLLGQLNRVPVDTPAAAQLDSKVLAQGHAPSTALAEISADGQFIRVSQPMISTEAVTSYTMRESNGAKYYEPVTTYRQTTRTHMMSQRVESVKAFELDGTPIDAKKLTERIKKETAVLLVHGDDKVDPFYLQLIKPGTIIVSMPPPPPVPVPQPPPTIEIPKPNVPGPASP